MLDLKFVRENPEVVKQNIRNKFQDEKLPLVDEVIELDAQRRATQQEADDLRSNRKKISKQIGALMAQGKKEEADAVKEQVTKNAERLAELEKLEAELGEKVKKIMMIIPNIIDPSVPIGKDDSENVEIQKYGEPFVPEFEVPYHTDIMERFDGIDLDSARKVAGNGFYYLMGDIARLHSAVISYARDFMIDRGFTYCVPPFMIRSNVVTGVMSFDEYEKHIKLKGKSFGLMFVLLVCILIFVIKVICKEPYNDIMTIIWSVAFGYMSYEAYLSRSKPKFVTALFFVLFMLYYFYKFLTAGL